MRIDYKEKPFSERQIVPGYLEIDLKSGRFVEVWAINQETDERVQLVLNSQGQLCLQKGPSKLLYEEKRTKLVLDAIEVKETRDETAESVESTVPQVKSRTPWGHWAQKVPDPKTSARLPDFVPEQKEVKKQQVKVFCILPVIPRGTTISLEIEKYMDTFYQSAFEKKRMMGGKFSGFINVEAEIRNYPKMLDRLKEHLEEMSLTYTLAGAQPGFTMAKIIVHFEDYDLAEY